MLQAPERSGMRQATRDMPCRDMYLQQHSSRAQYYFHAKARPAFAHSGAYYCYGCTWLWCHCID